MCRYVVIALLLVHSIASAPSPLRLTIDCSDERSVYGLNGRRKLSNYNSKSRIDSFCELIHNAIPKAVENGKFILVEPNTDQDAFSDIQVPTAVAPPSGFVPNLDYPKLKVPKVRIPQIIVPKLIEYPDRLYKAPRVGSPLKISAVLRDSGEESSAEKIEVFKKGIKKLLHVVKVLSKIDQYLSERTRIIIDKLYKTFAD